MSPTDLHESDLALRSDVRIAAPDATRAKLDADHALLRQLAEELR